MSLTSFTPTLKKVDVPVPEMGKDAVIIVTERTVANAMRYQDLLKLIDDEGMKNTECLIAIMLMCCMKKPDGSYLVPDNTIESVQMIAYQTSDEVNSRLYDAYVEMNPMPKAEPGDDELDAKKKKS